MNKLFVFLMAFVLMDVAVLAGKMTPEEYIDKFKSNAIKEMKRTGIPASITLAQGLLESANGNSDLAQKANNHFGIKCHSDWKGDTYLKDDDKKNDCFRKYDHVLDSYQDHSDFLTSRSRYAFLFEFKSTDYKAWAHGLKKAGYATNPKYPELLINLIEKYSLHQYDEKVKHPSGAKDKDKVAKGSKETKESNTISISSSRYFVSDNFVKYVLALKGEDLAAISKLTGVSVKRLLKYNEKTSQNIEEGEKLYIQPKRKSAREKYHTVSYKESILSIAQQYAVTTKSIRKRNLISMDKEVQVGQQLKLKGRRIKLPLPSEGLK